MNACQHQSLTVTTPTQEHITIVCEDCGLTGIARIEDVGIKGEHSGVMFVDATKLLTKFREIIGRS